MCLKTIDCLAERLPKCMEDVHKSQEPFVDELQKQVADLFDSYLPFMTEERRHDLHKIGQLLQDIKVEIMEQKGGCR